MAKSIEYCIVNNESGDDYVIPVDKLEHWDLWLFSESWQLADTPDYAVLLDGGRLVFKDWRISYDE